MGHGFNSYFDITRGYIFIISLYYQTIHLLYWCPLINGFIAAIILVRCIYMYHHVSTTPSWLISSNLAILWHHMAPVFVCFPKRCSAMLANSAYSFAKAGWLLDPNESPGGHQTWLAWKSLKFDGYFPELHGGFSRTTPVWFPEASIIL